MRRFIVSALFFAALIVAWHEIVTYKVAQKGGWSPVLAVQPKDVGIYLLGAVKDGTLWHASVVTMRRLIIGYAIGIVIGLPLGLLTARWEFCADTIGVLALGFQTLPSVCWVPLALLWFGQTETAMLFVVIMGSLWSVVIATDNGVRTVPPIYARAARTMGSKQTAYLAEGDRACLVAVHRQRYETGMGVCVALAHGGGDLCHDSHRRRPWAVAAERP